MSPAELLDHPLCQALALTLLHFVWQGLAIAWGLALVTDGVGLRRPRARYASSLAALLLLAACPLVTLMWLANGIEGGRHAAAAIVAQPQAALEPGPNANWPPSELVVAAEPYIVTVWLTGVVLLGCRLLLGAIGVWQLRRNGLPLPSELAHRVMHLGHRLRLASRPLVFLSRRVSEAMAVGIIRPIVLIPAAWATEMPLDLLEAVIAHELAHLRRRDLWVILLERIVETLLFYHPAVWWVSRRLRIARELCCDELAVAATGRRLEYVQALETVARRAARVEPLLAAGIRGEKNMRLLERVRNVLGLAAGGDRSRLWPAGLVALLLPLAAWAYSTGLVAPQGTVAIAAADDDDKKGDKPRAVKDKDDDDEKAAAKKGSKDKDADDDDEKQGGDKKAAVKKSNKDKDADDDEKGGDKKDGEKKPAIKKDGDGRKEKEPVKKEAVKKEGERKEGEKKEGEKKEVRKDGDKPEAAREKRERSEEARFFNKESAREGDRGGVKKEGPRDGDVRKPGPKDGDRPAKEGEGRKVAVKDSEAYINELAAMVKKLTAENERLRAELAAARGEKGREKEPAREKEGAVRFKEPPRDKEEAIRDKEAAIKRAAAEKEEAIIRVRKVKDAPERKDGAEKKEGAERKEAAVKKEAAERQIKEGGDKEPLIRRDLIEKKRLDGREADERALIERKRAEAAKREAEKKDGDK